MKSILKNRGFLAVSTFLFIFFMWNTGFAQCYNCNPDGSNNSEPKTSPAFAPDWTNAEFNTVKAGQYLLFSVQKGVVYRWSTLEAEDYIIGGTRKCEGTNTDCEYDSDCSGGKSCISDMCESNSHCTSGFYCLGVKDQCLKNADCSSGTCNTVNNKCVCAKDSDCSQGYCDGDGDCSCDTSADCSEGFYCGADGKCSSKYCSLFDTEITVLKSTCAEIKKCEGTSTNCTVDTDCAVGVKCVISNLAGYNWNAVYKNQSQVEWKSDMTGNVAVLISNYKCQSCIKKCRNTDGTIDEMKNCNDFSECDSGIHDACVDYNCGTTTLKWQRIDSSHCDECGPVSDYRYPDASTVFSAPAQAPTWTTVANNNLKAGSYQVFNVVKDRIYRWTTCTDPSFDSQLTLFRGAGTEGDCGKFLAYNDDASVPPCADGSKQTILEWHSDFTGDVTVLANEYSCQQCFKSPSSTPWAHCSLTTLDWQRYDCNNCSGGQIGSKYTDSDLDAPKTVIDIEGWKYIKLDLKKGTKYRFTSLDGNTTTTFTGVLTLRKISGTACSGDLYAQSVKIGSQQVIDFTSNEDTEAELLISGAGCDKEGTKKARVKLEKVYDPSTRFEDDFDDESELNPPACCDWNGVTKDSMTGMDIYDYTNETGLYADTWLDAINYCEGLVYIISGLPGRGSQGEKIKDWVLPNINQLYSIVDFDIYDKATSYRLPSYDKTSAEGATCTKADESTDCAGYPDTICGDNNTCVRNNWYWSSTTVDGSSYFSWSANMKNGLSYRVLKENYSGLNSTPAKVLCVRGTNVSGELDINRAARERVFSGWACDTSYTSKTIDIYFVIYDKDKKIIEGPDILPGKLFSGKKVKGFKYGETDLTADSGSSKEAKIAANCKTLKKCEGTATTCTSDSDCASGISCVQETKHAFSLDLKDDTNPLSVAIKTAASGETAPYYVTAFAGNYTTGWIPAGTFELVPEKELFVLVDDCGDSYRTVGEDCDDGNSVTEDCAYGTSCTVCNDSCLDGPGNTSWCGDGTLSAAYESCDCGGATVIGDYPPVYEYESATCGSELPNNRCDDYSSVSTDTCTLCIGCSVVLQTVPYCGDGYKDSVEACDDGNANNNDGCTDECLLAFCGDGYIYNTGAGTEVCDDGAKNGLYETECNPGPCCNTTCTGQGPRCGDKNVDSPNETCDNGNLITDPHYNGKWYSAPTAGTCNSTCNGPAAYCGDKIIQSAYEYCDDGTGPGGNINGVYGRCQADCQNRPRCGDGIINGGEVCDDGAALNGQYGKCNLTCTGTTYCGDGVTQSSHEVCDPGSQFFTEYAIKESESCTSSCVIGKYCGDSVTDSADGELCDDGAGNKPLGVATGYLADCIDANGGPGKACKFAHYCGDGLIDGPGGTGYLGGWEVCDDGPGGNVGEYSKCDPGCVSKAPYCGDGIRQRANCSGYTPCSVYTGSNEQCDNGASNTTAPGTYTATCRPECTYAKCGDGVIDTAMGEECDDGVANDDAAPLACRTNCKFPKCGDGILDPGEQCDDSNLDNFDACTDMCQLAKCGDSIRKTVSSSGPGIAVQPANEACDDGNVFSGDYCRNDCLAVTGFCGDGVKQTNESCDKATTGVGIGAYCSTDCKNILGRCGDGAVQSFAGEVCDHNDQPNGNYCAPDCKSQYGAYGSCGDGIIQANEVCDKATFGAGIGAYCSNDCKANLGSCGDGVVQRNSCSGYTLCTALITTNCCKVVPGANEFCDDGANNGAYKAVTNVNDAYCNTNCGGRGQGGFCGDNNTQSPHENCDDGANNGLYSTSSPFCSADCQEEGGAGYCGNGTKEGPEQCDISAGVVSCAPGTAPNGNPYYSGQNTACLGTCTYDYSVCKYCGDGMIQRTTSCSGYTPCEIFAGVNEICDTYSGRANRNEWGPLQACRTNCGAWAPFCGDGILHRQDCAGGVWLDPSTGTNRACVQSNGAWETCEAASFGGAMPSGCISCSKFAPHGNFETSTDGNSDSTAVAGNIEGWACDRDTPNTNIQITIKFYNKNGTNFHNKAVFTHKAREAAVQTSCLSSINTHGFSYNPKTEANYSTLFNPANRPFKVEIVAHDTTPGAPTATLGVACSQPYGSNQCYYGGYCGDGTNQTWYSEQCDPSTWSTKCNYGETSCTRCNSSCQWQTSYDLTGYCGDGTRQATWEQCDPENNTTCPYSTSSPHTCVRCTSSCTTYNKTAPYCGDGTIQTGESCDNGASNSNSCGGKCKTDCSGKTDSCGW